MSDICTLCLHKHQSGQVCEHATILSDGISTSRCLCTGPRACFEGAIVNIEVQIVNKEGKASMVRARSEYPFSESYDEVKVRAMVQLQRAFSEAMEQAIGKKII